MPAPLWVCLRSATLRVDVFARAWSPEDHARPFVVGMVHGLAGSAAATLLVLPLLADSRWAAAYLLVFGAGTVLGMSIVTAAIAAPAALAAGRLHGVQRWLRVASGAVSLGFGGWMAWRIGMVEGLFAY